MIMFRVLTFIFLTSSFSIPKTLLKFHINLLYYNHYNIEMFFVNMRKSLT